MRKQTWLAMIILSCGVWITGCGAADKSYQKGIAAMQAGKYEDAGSYFEKAIQKNGERAEYYIAYGMYLNQQGQYEDALKQFKDAYQDTSNTIANVNNKQVYLGQTISYYHLGDYEKSLELCDKALKLKNTTSLNSRLWCSKGVVLESLGQTEDALKAYNEAVQADKENWQAYYRMSAIYLSDDDQVAKDADAAQQAREFLIAAYKKGEKDVGYYLGELYFLQGDTDQGKKYLEKYVSKANGDYLTDAYNELAAMAIEAGDYSQAEEYLTQGRNAASGEAAQKLWKNQMILMERQGMFGEARKIAGEYLQKYPDDTDMKREYRFLKTRDNIAKGTGAVNSGDTAAASSAPSMDEDNAAGTGTDTKGTSSENGQDTVGTVENTQAPSGQSTVATRQPERTESSTGGQSVPAASTAPAAKQTAAPQQSTAARTTAPLTNTEEKVGY